MTKPVVASVSEPMRMLVPLRAFQTSLAHGNMTLHVPAQLTEEDIKDIEELFPLYLRAIRRWRTSITIPGETDDAPPATVNGWRPASEPPENCRNVAVRVNGHPPTTVGWRLTGGEWEVLYTAGVMREAPENIEGWAELPPAPGGKRE